MNENQDIDNDMIGWLYGELDEDASRQFESRMEADAALRNKVEALGSVGQRFEQLEAEVPSMALRGNLLREAAKASTPQSLWDKLLGSWFMKPGVFAMASMVLVIGIAGILHKRGGLEFAEREAALVQDSAEEVIDVAKSESAGNANEPMPTGDEAVVEVLDAERQLAVDNASSDLKTVEEKLSLTKEAPAKRRKAKKSGKSQSFDGAKPKSKIMSNSKSSLGATSDFEESERTKAYRPSKRESNRVDSFGAVGGVSKTVSKRDYAEAPPVDSNVSMKDEADADDAIESAPSKAPSSSSSSKGSAPSAEAATPAKSPKKVPQRLVRSLDSMHKAAQTKRCTDAARIANDIRDSDASFYAKTSLERVAKNSAKNKYRRKKIAADIARVKSTS